jgi:hypothetical protein
MRLIQKSYEMIAGIREGYSVCSGAAVGGLGGSQEGVVGSFSGAIVAGAIAGILDLIHETLGDGPKCQD